MRIRSWIPCALFLLLAACGQPQTTPADTAAPLLSGTHASLEARPGHRQRNEYVLFDFGNRYHDNGERPRSGLVVGPYGSLFGTTTRGGKLGCPGAGGSCGIVYVMSNTDSGYIEIPLYLFCQVRGCADGALPYAGVTFDKNKALYGTTYEGGAKNSGVVFKMPRRKNGWYANEHVLYSFCAQARCADGSNPRGTLTIDASGAIYGTTLYGGSKNGGVVFKLTPASSGYTESVLHAFTGPDGLYPEAGVIADANGALYGTTASGGASGCDTGCGVVYKLTPNGSQYTETVLHEFTGGSDGTDPYAGLVVDRHGNLFGVTVEGGGTGCAGNGCGIAFEMTPAGSTYTESVLHAFAGTDGSAPNSALLLGTNGELFGTTSSGGLNNEGTLFSMLPGQSYAFRSLYSFCKYAKCTDGATPVGGIVRYYKTLYGTTWQGGHKDEGTVYELPH